MKDEVTMVQLIAGVDYDEGHPETYRASTLHMTIHKGDGSRKVRDFKISSTVKRNPQIHIHEEGVADPSADMTAVMVLASTFADLCSRVLTSSSVDHFTMDGGDLDEFYEWIESSGREVADEPDEDLLEDKDDFFGADWEASLVDKLP